MAMQRIRATQRSADGRLEGVVQIGGFFGQNRRVGQSRRGERALVQIAKHEPQVSGPAQRAHDRLDGLPVVIVLDGCRTRRELPLQQLTRPRAESAILMGEKEVTHERSRTSR